nr:tetratricopeptide repeat protein [Methanocella arvoryzae]
MFGKRLIDAGLPDEALTALRKAVEVDPDSVIAHYTLGNAFLSLRQIDDAMAEFQKCIALNPKMPGPHFSLAKTYDEAGMKNDAKAELEIGEQVAKELRGSMQGRRVFKD